MTDTSITYEPNLSAEHVSQIHFEGLYKADPEDFRSFYQSGSRYWNTSSKYHCRNWCFEPHVHRDGRVFMVDNYWSFGSDNMSYELTDENFDEMFQKFYCVMENRDEWSRISSEAARKYDPKDIVSDVACDSGGYSCGSTTWLRKGAKPAVAREISVSKGKLATAMRNALDTWELGQAVKDIERLIEEAKEEGIDYTDAVLLAEMNQAIAEHAGDPVRFGDVHDMEEYLAHRCHCPGEIYATDGMFYAVYKADCDVKPVGSAVELDEGYSVENYLCEEKEEIIQVLVDAEGRVADTVRFDSTPSNLRKCASGAKPSTYKVDSFPMTWNNFNTEEVLEKARAVYNALEELSASFR